VIKLLPAKVTIELFLFIYFFIGDVQLLLDVSAFTETLSARFDQVPPEELNA